MSAHSIFRSFAWLSLAALAASAVAVLFTSWLLPNGGTIACVEDERPQATISNCSKAIEDFEGEESQLARYLHLRGRAHVEAHEYDSAKADLDRSIELNPRSSVYFDRGRVLYFDRQYDAAVQDLKHASTSKDVSKAAYELLAKVYEALGDRELAEQALRNARVNAPDFDGRAAELSGEDKSEAERRAVLIRRCSGKDPHDEVEACSVIVAEGGDNLTLSQGYVARARAHLRNRSRVDAIGDFTAALELNPRNADGLYGRGYAHYLEGSYPKALNDMDAAIEQESSSAAFYSGRGWIRYAMGDYQPALEDFAKAISLNPKSADAYNGQAWAFAKAGDRRRAIESIDQAVTIDATYSHAKNRLAQELQSLKSAGDTRDLQRRPER